MRFRSFVVLLLALSAASAEAAPKKALFDNLKGEAAGNADWVIDNDQPTPGPAQSAITWATPENYWTGAASAWGVQLVKRGYQVATLVNSISYQNPANPFDLSNFDVFIVPEPNLRFTAAESTAIFNFVRDGGGVVAVSDHSGSDRNGDGFDSPMIWNLLDPQHRWGVHFGEAADANNNIVQTSANVDAAANDSIIHGAAGVATAIAFHNGTTMTLDPAANPTVRGNVWLTGVPQSSTSGVMVAQSVYGNGRVVFVGDSSPLDDGSANPGNSSIFNGWGEAGGSDSLVFLNATLWATRRDPPGDTQAPTVTLASPVGGEVWKAGSSHSIQWSASDDVGVTLVDLAYSTDGGLSYPNAIGSGPNWGAIPWTVPDVPTGSARLRVTAHDAAGQTATDASPGNFTIDRWVIAASAGGGGTIVPAGAIPIVEGASAHFSIAASPGYAIASLIVDGAPLPPDTTYTFAGVAAAHTLAATFADAVAPLVQVTAPNGGESWNAGTTHAITWNATDATAVDSVRLDYAFTVHGVPGNWNAIASGLSNSGSFDWLVPEPGTPPPGCDPDCPSDSAVVRVTAYDPALNAGVDLSDDLFQVIATVSAVGDAAAPQLQLARPLPNPARGTTRLTFSLPAAGRARLELVDLSGRSVWRLARDFGPGTHVERIEAAGDRGPIASGMYFVRLVTPWGTRTTRLLWLR